MNRDSAERYVVFVKAGSLRVFNHDTGVEVAVSAPGGYGYLSSPGASYRAITVADYTFIVNTDVVCALEDVGADETPQPDYYVWPGVTKPTKRADVIYSVTGEYPLAGEEAQYGPNPTSTGILTGTVQKFEDLPTTSVPTGAIYQVSGSADSGFVSYYVRWSGTVWDETVAPTLKNSLDALTMPHALVRQSDGTFKFAPFSWKPRRVGDLTTNPNPPFIGRKLRDVVFYQNRLGFLVDETVVFSAAGDYGDFWRRTVLDYIDSDTLAVSASTTDVAILEYAVPFNDGIMLFSQQRQFSLSNGESGLSAASVEISPVTSFAMATGVRPAPLGSQVYFASGGAGKASIQEYTRLDGSDATDAADITAHVPGLLGSGLSQLVALPDLNAVLVLKANSDERNKVYVYQFFWDRDEKIISAWRPWDLGSGEVLSVASFDGIVRMVVKRGTKVVLEKLDLRTEADFPNQDHTIYLDRAVSITGVYNGVADTTTFTLPYAVIDTDLVRMVRSKTATYPESLIPVPGYVFGGGGTTITVPGNEAGAPVTIGDIYETRLQFTRQFPHDYQGRPLTTGRLQLHAFSVTYSDTAYFESAVQPYGPEAISESSLEQRNIFNGRILSSGGFILGRMAYRTGTFTFPVAADAALATVALVNDSPYASTWVSAEWEGLYFSRAL